MIWVDVTDILVFLKSESSVSGIQRASLELTAAMFAKHKNIGVCTYCEEDSVFKALPFEDVLARGEVHGKKDDNWPWIKKRIAKTAISLVHKKYRRKLGLEKDQAKKGRCRSNSEPIFFRGDVLAHFSAFWQSPNHVDRLQKAIFVNEMKFAVMIHDLIPVNHPYWFTKEFTIWWQEKLKTLIRRADYIFSNSEFTANEVRKFALDNQIQINPITILRFGDPTFLRNSKVENFGKGHDAADPQYRGTNFILMVSSIDIRKNQKFLVPIWCRLIKELGWEATPDLLLVGKNGTNSQDFFSLLGDSPELKNKVVILNQVGDNELAYYYHNALFTVFPSLAEGWGFPVAESLSFGKICVASGVDAIPEVGGRFACYFAANDANGAYNLIKRFIVNSSERARLESVIANGYRTTDWTTSANAVLAALSKVEEPL